MLKNKLKKTGKLCVELIARIKGYQQYNNTTYYNRYPEIFSFIGNQFTRESDNLKILSYGCSTGLECHSIRKYFKSSEIFGYDINKKNIIQAIKENCDPAIFFYDKIDKINISSSYDIIFAMSVLCRWPNTEGQKDCSKIYAFENFESNVKLLDELLKPGGFLVIYNANFRFVDTVIFDNYVEVAIPNYEFSGFVHKFSSTNNLLENQNYPFCVFRKKN